MAVQCAALGIINIGGFQDSHELLFSDTATNDWRRLEEVFQKINSDSNYRNSIVIEAFDKAMNHYSHEAVKKRFLEVIE